MQKERFEGISPSPTSLSDEISKIEKKIGTRIIRFDLAEPTFPPPNAAINRTIEAIRLGKYKYSSSWGIPELRQAISEYLAATRGLAYSCEEVLITNGAKFANYSFFAGLLKQKDAVLLLKPYWMSFKAVPQILGLNVLEVQAKEPYHLDEEALIAAMKKRPRAIVVNSPNNPTGGLFDEADLRLLKDLSIDFDMLVLSDEIDWAYVYDGRRFISSATLESMQERTIITDGFSKLFGMTGWRVGFAAGPKELLAKMHTIQAHVVGAPATFAQYGCLAALEGFGDYLRNIVMQSDLQRKRTVKALNTVAALECPLPEGGFYAYPFIKSKRFTTAAFFAEKLLREAGVAVIPGEHFGDSRGRFRLCYAVSDSDLSIGLERISRFLQKA
ncbi:MAG: aminotransferase class I/II-fold pyridoxal phosphate-dependent enzyme [Candidatus Methanomethylicaceae archaeon]